MSDSHDSYEKVAGDLQRLSWCLPHPYSTDLRKLADRIEALGRGGGDTPMPVTEQGGLVLRLTFDEARALSYAASEVMDHEHAMDATFHTKHDRRAAERAYLKLRLAAYRTKGDDDGR